MGLWSRIMMIFKMKTDAVLDKAEDPRQVLDYALAQQQELHRKVRQGLVEVATSKHQLMGQSQKMRSRVPQLEEQARRAMAASREDLARIALERKQTSLAEMERFDHQLASVEAEERKLTLAEQQLAARIEDFRNRRSSIAARYTAAEAQVRVNEAISGVSNDFAELSQALGRIEERTEQMQARASAIDALIESGSLATPIGGGDLVERELKQIEASKSIEDELAALRKELGPGEPPSALGSGS